MGARTPSSAQHASARSDSSKKVYRQPNSRYALSADEGVRAPSNRRFLPVGYVSLSLIALHDRENVSRRILEPGDRRPVIPVNPLRVCLYFAFIVLEVHTLLFQIIHHCVDVVHLKIQDRKRRWFVIRLRIDEDT